MKMETVLVLQIVVTVEPVLTESKQQQLFVPLFRSSEKAATCLLHSLLSSFECLEQKSFSTKTIAPLISVGQHSFNMTGIQRY